MSIHEICLSHKYYYGNRHQDDSDVLKEIEEKKEIENIIENIKSIIKEDEELIEKKMTSVEDLEYKWSFAEAKDIKYKIDNRSYRYITPVECKTLFNELIDK